jgi:integrase
MKHEFPGLLRDKTAAGTIRFRVRVEGNRNKKIKIPVGPGEPTFHEHYAAARLGEKVETVKPASVKVGTLDNLCDKYLTFLTAMVEGGTSSNLTLKGHKSLLTQACDVKDGDGDRMGGLNAEMPEEGFVHIQDSFGSRTGAADNCIKALRAAYRWGEKRGYPRMSPVFDVEKVHKNRGGATPWTVKEMRQFFNHHGTGTMARLWLLESLNTLPRIGDTGRLGDEHMSEIDGDKWIGYQPGKKGSAFVSVPALPQFLAELALHPDRDTFLETEVGNPFASPESLRNKIQDWTAQAGLPKGRTQHGVRKGAAELLAAAGATQYEIMCLMAHTEAKTSEVYTKRVERAGLAKLAIAKMAAIDFDNVDHE